MARPIEVLLFDLGGVLVDFSGVADLQALLPGPSTTTDVLARWIGCPHSLAFGMGSMSTEQFAERFIRDWGIALEPGAFLSAYRSWCRGLLPGARDLLLALRPRYRLAALSNSNEVHWAALAEDPTLVGLFDAMYSSHQLGVRKPDAAIYGAALERLAAPAASVLFFDDAEANVEAARRAGLEACRADGVEGVRRCLRGRGLL